MSAWSRLGMNYGNDLNYTGSLYDTSQIDADLVYIKQFTNYIRIAMPGDTSETGITQTQYCCTKAKELGFYVTWGVTGGTYTQQSHWDSFAANVEIQAAWAQANGLDEFSIGNEEEIHNGDGAGFSDLQVRDGERALATSCQAIFTRGPIACAVSQDFENNWITEGKGDIDLFDLHVYGTLGSTPSFQSHIEAVYNEWGNSGMYIGEWNLHPTWSSVPGTEERQAIAIGQRMQIIDSVGVSRAYFFCWRNATGVTYNNNHATKKANGEYHLWWNNLTTNNKRCWFVNV